MVFNQQTAQIFENMDRRLQNIERRKNDPSVPYEKMVSFSNTKSNSASSPVKARKLAERMRLESAVNSSFMDNS